MLNQESKFCRVKPQIRTPIVHRIALLYGLLSATAHHSQQQEQPSYSSFISEIQLTYCINKNNSEDHQNGYDCQSKLKILLKLTTNDNSIQGTLFETGCAVLTMMVMMMMMLLGTGTGHINR
jgi:hypothetical protein